MKMVYVNPKLCLGCHSCELACAVAHSQSKDLIAAVWAGERPGKRIYVEPVDHRGLPLTCRHCAKAPCLEACPTEAIWRDARGTVLIEEERCIGCHACEEACPFGVITVLEEVAIKCDLCQGDPACVKACPTRALHFGDPRQRSRLKRKTIATLSYRKVKFGS